MLRVAIEDCHVLAFGETCILQALTKSAQTIRYRLRRSGIEKSNERNRLLLGMRNEQPRYRRTAEQIDEFAPIHSITSSARASSVAGMVKPSAFAVLRLTTSSYLVGPCTGRSAGFSPFRMRLTYSAALRNCWSTSYPYDTNPPVATK